MLRAAVEVEDVVLGVRHEHGVRDGVHHPPQPLLLDGVGFARATEHLHVLLARERSARLPRERDEPLQVDVADAALPREQNDRSRSVAASAGRAQRCGDEAAELGLGRLAGLTPAGVFPLRLDEFSHRRFAAYRSCVVRARLVAASTEPAPAPSVPVAWRGESPSASASPRYVSIEATTTRASTVIRSMPTSDTQTQASMMMPLSRMRSRTSMRLEPPGLRSTTAIC